MVKMKRLRMRLCLRGLCAHCFRGFQFVASEVDVYIIVPLAQGQSGGLRNIASRHNRSMPVRRPASRARARECSCIKAMLRLFRAAKSLRSMRMAPCLS